MTFATLVNQLIINTLSLPPPVSGGGRKSSCFMKADKKKRCLYCLELPFEFCHFAKISVAFQKLLWKPNSFFL